MTHGSNAERPWWRRSSGLGWVRLDGSKASTPTPSYMEFVDGARPLPFPGLRVGQTWAVNVTATDAAVFTITEYDVDHIELTGRAPAGHATGKAQPWHAGGAWITDAELRDLCRDGYLLADAVCPHLAPWSPCEEKP